MQLHLYTLKQSWFSSHWYFLACRVSSFPLQNYQSISRQFALLSIYTNSINFGSRPKSYDWPYFGIRINGKSFLCSSSLRPGTKAITCGKWIIGHNFCIDDGTESKFGTHKELIVFNILKYKHCVNRSRICHVTILLKIVNYWPIGGQFKKRNREKNTKFTFGMTVHCTSIKNYEQLALWGKLSLRY